MVEVGLWTIITTEIVLFFTWLVKDYEPLLWLGAAAVIVVLMLRTVKSKKGPDRFSTKVVIVVSTIVVLTLSGIGLVRFFWGEVDNISERIQDNPPRTKPYVPSPQNQDDPSGGY